MWRTRKRRVQQWRTPDWPLRSDRFSGHPSLWSLYFCWPLCTSVILWNSKYLKRGCNSLRKRIDYELPHVCYTKFNINTLTMLVIWSSRGATVHVPRCRVTANARKAAPVFGADVCVWNLRSRRQSNENVASCWAFSTSRAKLFSTAKFQRD